MHIKQVLIEGFKSYKDQTLTEEFDPRINVVAIRFVLNDAFINMRGDERLQLLHEGAGHRVSSAWVEVVFDNSDGRFPMDRNEIRLRRTISAKKDEYTLDKKHINKSEVSSLLESAGFSKSNPYYIVQQGKITAMAAMTDAQRMELLKEIGGTRVYEERRRESERIMSEAGSRGSQIKGMLSEIEDKLRELDTERSELLEFQELDRRRRCLRYTLYDKELAKAMADLEKLERDAARLRETAGSAAEDGGRAEAELKELERQLRALEAEAGVAEGQAKDLKARRSELTASVSRAEVEIEELAGRVDRTDKKARSAARELEELRVQVAAEQGRLEKLREAAASAESAHAVLAERLAGAQSRQDMLYRKQGATRTYGSREERDAALQKRVAATEELLSSKRAARERQRTELQQHNEMLMELSQAIGDMEGDVRTQEARTLELDRQYAEAYAARNQLLEARRGVERDDANAEKAEQAAEEKATAARQALQKCMPKDVRQGVLGLDALRTRFGVDMRGVHGTVIEHITANETFYVAIDTIAGNHLFDVLVDTDEVASRLIRELGRHRLGRATFVPLNRVGGDGRDPEPPTQFGTDVIPLLRKIQFEPQFRPAMKDLFGQCLLCKDKDVATERPAGRRRC
ncbi:hypothetical protein GPECTOR_34g678 [Gonium pectorale]|uniref:SMC hinge domain-containing protein n=1 Tax=Gonium pectorale TaxID=33097 RepID=A0A150GCG0_GONPE|nr:hypothetical protein GPECTOR_34g678 [Gonium pectorale]|eukprot:KXZ47519.1 hypothetical protein GPECTOR_34g678 [Gonium pectorale]